MRVLNSGDTPFAFTAALHTYIEVADIGAAKVRGLKGLTYLDKVRTGLGGKPAADVLLAPASSLPLRLAGRGMCSRPCQNAVPDVPPLRLPSPVLDLLRRRSTPRTRRPRRRSGRR